MDRYKNRIIAYAKYSGTTQTDSASYSVDALDRPSSETETHSGSTTTTTFRYIGDTNAVSKETLTGATNTTRKYAYDADGQRITITDGANRYSYLYDPHNSVSLLLDQANAVKSSYGYNAYGSSNTAITRTATGFTDRNPFKYSAKRMDTGSSTYDMGARRYSSATGRWLQQDIYFEARSNLWLSESLLNSNRYLFAGANPITYAEIDGHLSLGPAVADDGAPVPQPNATNQDIAGDEPTPRAESECFTSCSSSEDTARAASSEFSSTSTSRSLSAVSPSGKNPPWDPLGLGPCDKDHEYDYKVGRDGRHYKCLYDHATGQWRWFPQGEWPPHPTPGPYPHHGKHHETSDNICLVRVRGVCILAWNTFVYGSFTILAM